MIKKTWCMYALLLLPLAVYAAQSNSIPRTLSVTGTARVYAEPDEVTVSFTLYTKDADLIAAKKKNDESIQKLTKILKDFSIEKEHFALDYSTISPEYDYHRQTGERIRSGYAVRQNISVKLTDITQYEAFITALLYAGIDTVNSTEFGSSRIRQHTDDARTKAVQAAIQKAELYCRAASEYKKNVKLGHIIEIREADTQKAQAVRMMRSQNAKYSALEAAQDGMEAGSMMPIGVISIQAEVEVVFSLD